MWNDVEVGTLLSRVVIVATVGVVLSVAQRLAPEDPHARRTWRGRVWDGVFIVQYLTLMPLVGLAVATIVRFADGSVDVFGGLPFGARLVIGLVGVDVGLYAVHRGSHSVRWMWWLHSVHHRATEIGWATAFRFHVGDAAIQHAVPLVALAALGVGLDALAVVTAVVFVVSVLAHANLEVPPGWVRILVATPWFHRTHHEVGYNRTNFAVMFPLLDVAFGSACLDRTTRDRFGLESTDEAAEPAGAAMASS